MEFDCETDYAFLPGSGQLALFADDGATMRTRMDEEIDVDFTVESDDFAVPEWPGLRCSATFRVTGVVNVDHSGDSVTPDGPESADVMLMDPTAFGMNLVNEARGVDEPLPDWLQQRLVQDEEFDAGFLASVGGMEKLESLAIEKARA